MTAIVVDASVAVAWHFEDEAPRFWDLLIRVAEAGAVVPSLFPYEVANVLVLAERRGRSTMAARTAFLDRLRSLPIEVDSDSTFETYGRTQALAQSEDLTVYDAGYLALALRRGLPLATQDDALRRAAKRLGTSILPN